MSARFYIITGKGGVGKTLISLALVNHLQKQKVNVCYTSMHSGSDSDFQLANQLKLNSFYLNTKESAQLYMSKKLKSPTIASWIAKTPFFDSIFNMLPGFSDLIFLGHLVNKLKTTEDLTIVLDSPATGHVLSLLESPGNFKDIFKSGPIVKDIDEIVAFLSTPGNLQTIILSLPNAMSYQEGIELQEQLKQSKACPSSQVIINEVFSLNDVIKNTDEVLPPYLANKLVIEKDIISGFKNKAKAKTVLLPYIASNDPLTIIKSLTKNMKEIT